MASQPPQKEQGQNWKNIANTNKHIKELLMISQLQQYHLDSLNIKKEWDRLIPKIDGFQVFQEEYLTFKIQQKSFKIPQTVLHSPDNKQKRDPLIWYVETVCPGSPQMVYESLLPKYRKEWDSHFASFRKIQIDDAFPNIHLWHSPTNRDFVEIISIHELASKATGYRCVRTASKSNQKRPISRGKRDHPATMVLSGVLCEKLSISEMDQMKLPKLINREITQVEWTRIRYIVQTDQQEWIASGINAVMPLIIGRMMCDLRNFVIEKRLRLHPIAK